MNSRFPGWGIRARDDHSKRPAGTENAHQVVNRSGTPCTYLIFGTRVSHDTDGTLIKEGRE